MFDAKGMAIKTRSRGALTASQHRILVAYGQWPAPKAARKLKLSTIYVYQKAGQVRKLKARSIAVLSELAQLEEAYPRLKKVLAV